jgi:putative membrane protein
MPLVAQVLAIVAALLHVLFFYLESIAWRKGAWKSFGVTSQADADIVAPMAFNQGFYNLFLAVGVIIGVALDSIADQHVLQRHPPIFDHNVLYGRAFVIFGLGCMVAAAIVLLVSSRGRLFRGALIQGAVPAIALIVLAASPPPSL